MGVALVGIYAMLAVLFRSYVQPIVVMSAIPFGFAGAVFGHILMDQLVRPTPLSFLSLFGIVALSGVVVNDSLILIDLINRRRMADGDSTTFVEEGVIEAGLRRFRPIFLTTMTTFFGLVPIILETSLQAQFIIPMAISLGFGILFATAITLLLVPSLYMIVEDVRRLLIPVLGENVRYQGPAVQLEPAN
jgi:multidrug efflux pump subunit AcrB